MFLEKIYICFIDGRSVGENYFLVTFEFAVKQLKCTDDILSPSFYTHGREAERHIRNVNNTCRLLTSAEGVSLPRSPVVF